MFFCHGYREHTSTMGNSLDSQRKTLDLFLKQWEMAADFHPTTEPSEIHISGDMNLDSLGGRWLEPGYNLYSLAKLVKNVCDTYNLSQLVQAPTRIQYNAISNRTNISCIDHVYTNAKHYCSPITVTSFGSSDHDMIGYTRYTREPPSPARTIRKRSYKNFVPADFLENLSQVDWTEVLCCDDVDIATDILTTKLREVLNIHAPWILFQQRKAFKPWITEEAKEMMKERDILKDKAKDLARRDLELGREPSEEQKLAWNKFKKLRNKITNKKHKDEINFKRAKLSEHLDSPEALWKSTKSFMGWKSVGTPSQLEVNGKLETKSSRIAQLMNNFFINKVRYIRDSLPNIPNNLAQCRSLMRGKQCTLQLSHVSEITVKKLLKNLGNSRSTAVDELDSYVVKLSAEHIARPLHHIITLSIMQDKFPTSWKNSKVIPLHKKLSNLDCKNYRPVTILSPFSKVLEKIVYQQLYDYFSENKLFHPNLHGYRKFRSTHTALLQMYDRWVRAAAAGTVSGVILLDLSAAFDLVDSDILCEKLSIYGVDRSLLAWIQSYLTGRYQAVWSDHVFSDFLPHSIGVPQGSNLGPLFFLIFYNDLLSSLDCSIEAYADDSTMVATGESVEDISDILTRNCDSVVSWMGSNKLKINADKTHLLTVGTQERLANLQSPVEVTMDGIVLQESENQSELLLGCQIQSNLKWSLNIKYLQKKLKGRLAGISAIKYAVPFQTRNIITIGMFNSVLAYCLPLFGGCSLREIKDLQLLQNRAAQLVTHLPPRSSRGTMFTRLKWLTVRQLVVYHTLLVVFKVRQSKEPEYLAGFLLNDNRMGNIIIPNTSLSLAKKSFLWRGSEAWNKLPQTLRAAAKISIFKKNTKLWVKEHIPPFYD